MGRERKGKEGKGGRDGKGRKGKGREGEGRGEGRAEWKEGVVVACWDDSPLHIFLFYFFLDQNVKFLRYF